MQKLWITVLLCVLWTAAFPQFDNNYIPALIQDTIPASVHSALRVKLESDKARITEPKGQVNTFIQELYDKRADFVTENFNADYFIVNDELTSYLKSVLDNIYKSNPALPRETSVYPFRSGAVNAMSFGEGTIAFTLGLFSRMETEAQIAFVLCHELAHYHQRHSDIQAMNYARLNFDRDVKKKVKQIGKSEYGKFTKYRQLMNSLNFSITRHSRDKELEADSIALLFYLNTSYDLRAPVRTLEILDSADMAPFTANLDLKKYFNFTAYPFKDRWLSYTPSNTWYASQHMEDNDSLRTHPSCKKRIEALQRQLRSVTPAGRRAEDFNRGLTRQMAIRSEFEMTASLFHFKQFGDALFQSLVLAEQYPHNIYLHARIGESFYELYRHQKNHELGNVLELPDRRYTENYDRFLTFIHTLRLTELASVAYYYPLAKAETCGNDEYFLYTSWLSAQVEVSQTDPGKIKTEYMRKFPNGKFSARMK
jgi:Zn-dependent protease with chaperone function